MIIVIMLNVIMASLNVEVANYGVAVFNALSAIVISVYEVNK